MRDGTERTVKGTIVNDIYGIDKRIYKGTSTAFFLTHIPSGVLITNADKKKSLMEIANLPEMIDQTDPAKIAKAVGKYWNDRWWKG